MVAGIIVTMLSGLLPAQGPHFKGQYFEWWALMTAFPATVAGYYRVSGRSDSLVDAGYYITLWLIFATLALFSKRIGFEPLIRRNGANLFCSALCSFRRVAGLQRQAQTVP